MFLLRLDLALRGNIYFSQLYELVVLFNSEEDFLEFKEDIDKKPRSGYGGNTWCSVHSVSHSKFTCPSCQDTIDLIKFKMCWYEDISVRGGNDFFQIPSWM